MCICTVILGREQTEHQRPDRAEKVTSIICFIPQRWVGRLRGAGKASEADGGADQQGAVIGRAVAVGTQQCHFVAKQRQWRAAGFRLTGEQVGRAGAEEAGDARQVAADLAGAAGLPLGDGAPGDADGARQLVLGEALGEAGGADAGAELGGWWIGHANDIGEEF